VLTHLPGYAPASAPGSVLVMTAALPWWRYAKAKRASSGATGEGLATIQPNQGLLRPESVRR